MLSENFNGLNIKKGRDKINIKIKGQFVEVTIKISLSNR
jgi:hypothetical protein